MLKKILIFSLFLTVIAKVEGQKFFRIKSDFSIKTKLANGTSQLVMGKAYYDKNYKKLIYINSFPTNETWLSIDTTIYCIKENKLISSNSAPPLAQFSIFHLALTSQINNYGLKNSMFKVSKVEKNKEKNMVITTWMAPFQYQKMFGKVLISNTNNKLFGIVFLDKNEKVLRKQFFNSYQLFSGLEFPTEIIDITYINGKENYQVTTYKNIEVDQVSEDNIYNMSVPNFK